MPKEMFSWLAAFKKGSMIICRTSVRKTPLESDTDIYRHRHNDVEKRYSDGSIKVLLILLSWQNLSGTKVPLSFVKCFDDKKD